MADEKPKTDKPKRMMARHDFKVLRNLRKELKKAQREYQEFVSDICDESGAEWWPDKMQPRLGFVLVAEDVPDGVVQEVLKLAPGLKGLPDKFQKRVRIPRETLDKLRPQYRGLDELEDKLIDKVVAVACACGVPTIMLNLDTGEITAEKVAECDPADEKGD